MISDRRVVLERGIPVSLRIAGALPELPAGWQLNGEIQRQSLGGAERGARGTLVHEPSFPFTAGEAQLWLAEPGKYFFTFLVVQDSGMRRASFWDEPQAVLEVQDGGRLQAFELRAPSEATVKEMLAFVGKHEPPVSRPARG